MKSKVITCQEELKNVKLEEGQRFKLGEFNLVLEDNYIQIVGQHNSDQFELILALAGLDKADIINAYGYENGKRTSYIGRGIWPAFKDRDYKAAKRAMCLLYSVYDNPDALKKTEVELKSDIEDAEYLINKLKGKLDERSCILREIRSLQRIVDMKKYLDS